MPAQEHEIRSFRLRSASQHDYARLNSFKNILRLEILPDDPPIPCAEDIQRWQAMPVLIREAAWAAWERSQDRVIAFGEADAYLTGDNQHLIDFRIEVLPEFRRRGLGSRMLRLLADCARGSDRHLMMSEANDRVPAGASFLTRIGARRGLEERMSELRLADLDRSLIRRWLERSTSLASDFDLGLWEDVYPDQRIREIAALLQVVANDQPRDALEMEDINYTPEFVRQFEQHMLSGGRRRWVLYALHGSQDRIAGLTEVLWSPARPQILEQGFTGVRPDFRNHGLGHWIKAAMLDKVLRELPEAKVIRAGNATSNAPMLKINQALGFKLRVSWTIWQVETDSVEKYLDART